MPNQPQFQDSYDDPMAMEFVQAIMAAGVDPIPEGLLERVFDNSIRRSARELLRTLNRTRGSVLREQWKYRDKFEKRLHRLWGTGLEKLEMLIVCSQEAGEDFNARERLHAAQAGDVVFDVLVRLHARALQTAREIHTLLRSGYAAGAHARWRTLHEIAVISAFIAKHGNETAERYLLHADIESHKAMRQYREYYAELGYESPDPKDVEDVENQKDALLAKYGQDFYSDYGWASAAMSNRKPKFSHLEEAAGLMRFRPFYRMSGHPVHAGAKGLLFNLGGGTRSLLPTGASNGGLADPGHSTAISLVQVTTALLAHKPCTQHLIFIRMMGALADEIGSAFLRAHRRWQERAEITGES